MAAPGRPPPPLKPPPQSVPPPSPVRKGRSSLRVRSTPSASAMVDSFLMLFRRSWGGEMGQWVGGGEWVRGVHEAMLTPPQRSPNGPCRAQIPPPALEGVGKGGGAKPTHAGREPARGGRQKPGRPLPTPQPISSVVSWLRRGTAAGGAHPLAAPQPPAPRLSRAL